MDIVIGFVGVFISFIMMSGSFKGGLGIFIFYFISMLACMVTMPDIKELVVLPVEYWWLMLIIAFMIKGKATD